MNEEFFKMLASFSKSFRKACDDNKRYEDMEKRKLRLEKEQQEKKDKRERRSSMKQQQQQQGGGEEKATSAVTTPVTVLKKLKKKTSPVRNAFGRKITPREALLLAIAAKNNQKKS